MQNSNYQIAPPFDEFNNQPPPQMQMNGGPPPSGQPRLTPQQRMPPMSGPGSQMMQPNYNGPMGGGGGGGPMPPHNGQMMGMQGQPMNGPNSYNQPPPMQMQQQQMGNMNLPPNQQMKMMGMNPGAGKIYPPGLGGPPECLNAQLGPGMDKNLANGGKFFFFTISMLPIFHSLNKFWFAKFAFLISLAGRFLSTNSNAPPRYYCRSCQTEVQENEQNIMCEAGCHWFHHRACTNLTDAAFAFLKNEVYAEWCCEICEQSRMIPLVKYKWPMAG